jgi:hypothetical protein
VQGSLHRGRSVPLALALAAGVAGYLVNEVGRYASGGVLGLVLAAALLGALVATLGRPVAEDVSGGVGVGGVVLFTVVAMGWLFGFLDVPRGAIVLAAPLLGLLPGLVPALAARPWVRGGVHLALTAAALGVALALPTIEKPEPERTVPAPADRDAPTPEDYQWLEEQLKKQPASSP